MHLVHASPRSWQPPPVDELDELDVTLELLETLELVAPPVPVVTELEVGPVVSAVDASLVVVEVLDPHATRAAPATTKESAKRDQAFFCMAHGRKGRGASHARWIANRPGI